MKAYLCLGSNLGDSKALIASAIELIETLPQTQVLRKSSLIETEPYGLTDQPRFWNRIVELETAIAPHDLLHQLQSFESSLGRIRDVKWGPRLIDIDILLLDDLIVNDPELTLPHPDFHNRDFALKLLAELIPEYKHPIIKKTIAELYHKLGLEVTSMSALAAIILAAGKGTRMKSNRAKVTFPIAGKPMVQRVVDTALGINCEKIAVVVGYQKESVIACLDDEPKLEFIEQTEQLGTGHAVMITEPSFAVFDGDVFILCGDVPLLSAETISRLHAEHQKTKAVCTVLTATLDDAGKYGRIIRDEKHGVRGIVEFKDASPLQREIKEFNTGIYVFDARELFAALKETSNTNQQNEYYLTDTLAVFYGQGKTISSVILEDLTEVSGVNSQEQLAELEDAYVDKIRKHWLNNGVMMHNPASIFIGDDVVIEADVEICQNTIIKGKTFIGCGSYLGPNCLLDHAKLGIDCILWGYNVLDNAILHDGEIMDYTEVHEEDLPYE